MRLAARKPKSESICERHRMKKRNSLIELYRFFFAVNVVKGHGFFPWAIPYFGPARVSVEFFFVLSGFLFVRSLERLRDMPLKQGLPRLIVEKMKPLFFPVVVGLICNLIYNIKSGEVSGLWGYLWYVHAMLLTFLAYLVLRRLVRSDRAFYTAVAVILLLATLMRFSGIFYSWGYVRAASTISLGMLLSRIPPIPERYRRLIPLALVPVLLATVAAVCFSLGNLEVLGGFRWAELILDLVLYPALIYLTFGLRISSRPLNYLGALSFGLYAFQCPADLLRLLGVENNYILLSLIVALAVLEDAAKRILRYRRRKKESPTYA